MSRPAWCPMCELHPGMVHPHEFYDPETLAPVGITQAAAAARRVRTTGPPRRGLAVRALARRGVRRHVAA